MGSPLSSAWSDVVGGGNGVLWRWFLPHAGDVAAWIARRAGGLGHLLGQLALTLVLAAFMYASGEKLASGTVRVGRRIGGDAGAALVGVAARAVRGAALGLVLTAVVQSLLAGIGLVLAGVPFAALLTAVLFVSAGAQIGMLVLLLPAVAWVYWDGHAATAMLLLAWSLAVSLLDNLLRPMLVRHSIDLPVLLVFVGVVGGLVALGPLGIFVGPVVLAVTRSVLVAWTDEGLENTIVLPVPSGAQTAR